MEGLVPASSPEGRGEGGTAREDETKEETRRSKVLFIKKVA